MADNVQRVLAIPSGATAGSPSSVFVSYSLRPGTLAIVHPRATGSASAPNSETLAANP